MKNVAALGLGSSNQKPSNTYDDPKMSLSKLLFFFYARIFHVQESSSGKVLVGLVDLLLRDELNQQNLKTTKSEFEIIYISSDIYRYYLVWVKKSRLAFCFMYKQAQITSVPRPLA